MLGELQRTAYGDWTFVSVISSPRALLGFLWVESASDDASTPQ